MKVILYLLEKEFKQIKRNKAILPIILVMPIVQMLVLSFAVDYEIKNLRLTVVDQDKTTETSRLIENFTSSDYFILTGSYEDERQALLQLDQRETDIIIIIPEGFSKALNRGDQSRLLLQIDALDGAKAGVAGNYAQSIIQSFLLGQLQEKALSNNMKIDFLYGGEIIPLYYYNPVMNYKVYMVPGILVALVTMIGGFLSAMNIVREKELGTIEQINVTPIRKHQFIISKTLPFWIIGQVVFTVGLGVAKLVFNIPIEGNLGVIYLFIALYLILVLGFGLFISTITQTQQQAMFVAWFFLVIFILMSGLFTPIENMPVWAQNITYVNPIRYSIEVLRMTLLKGSSLSDLKYHFIIVGGYGALIMSLAVWKYRKTN